MKVKLTTYIGRKKQVYEVDQAIGNTYHLRGFGWVHKNQVEEIPEMEPEQVVTQGGVVYNELGE